MVRRRPPPGRRLGAAGRACWLRLGLGRRLAAGQAPPSPRASGSAPPCCCRCCATRLTLAHTAASLDRIARGRLVLGVGPGADAPGTHAELAALGVMSDQQVSATLQNLERCRRLWRGEEPDVELLPSPHTLGGPPLWLGAHGPRLLRRAGGQFDGGFPSARPPTTTPPDGRLRARPPSRPGATPAPSSRPPTSPSRSRTSQSGPPRNSTPTCRPTTACPAR